MQVDDWHTCGQVNNAHGTLRLVYVLSTFAAGTTRFHTQVSGVQYYVDLKNLFYFYL